ncbi:MAG: hypothetical protein GF341_05045, partial [candidate division Zixibacteria bacterium]|nr:hypothetical protein [candidate division Zixibacteria bacterium]
PREPSSVTVAHPIEPVYQPFPLSANHAQIPPVALNQTVYQQAEPLPETRFMNLGEQTFRGRRLAILRLNPVDYVPLTHELTTYRYLDVRVTTASTAQNPRVVPLTQQNTQDLRRWIDNPQALAEQHSLSGGPSTYAMLILTPSAFVTGFQPLADYHTANGVITEIHTLESIGCSDPHCLRDYIRSRLLEDGISYVLLGADDDLIPALDMYVKSWEGPGSIYEVDLPGDIYFACLDGTYNYDSDSRWGEPGDGDGGGEVDLVPDVHVGRVPASSPTQVSNYVNKVLAYTSSNDPYLDQVLLAGEQLTFGGWGEYGGYAMDEMVDGSDAHGFHTYGFPSSVYTIAKLYDYLEPNNYWNPWELFPHLNGGVHIVDHLGHSDVPYAMRTDTLMLRQHLSNSEYFFVYAEGCNAGKFDSPDCWAEYMTTVLPTGAFGCVANARVGLGSRSTRHPVHIFNREFWDAIYDTDEAMPQIGRAMSDMRMDHIYHIDDGGIRWTMYETTLFGDPALAIKSVRDVAFHCPNGIPTIIPPHTETTVQVDVHSIGEGVPVAGSGQLHYWHATGETTSVAMAQIGPDAYETTLPASRCGEDLWYCFSIDEAVRGTLMYPSDSAYRATVSSGETVLFEDDFESDLGWSISGGAWQRGMPLGLGGQELQYPVPDPDAGCSGPQVMGYNLAGDYANNLGAVPVTSPPIDCSGHDNIRLRFCRWLGVERPGYDSASIAVSNDGITWTPVWGNYATIADLAWEEVEYDLSDVAANEPTVYVRWTMGPTDGGLVFCGWNIDDVRVVSLDCESCWCPLQGDLDGSGVLDAVDLNGEIDALFFNGPNPQDLDCPAPRTDFDSDGVIDAIDLNALIDHLFFNGPLPADPCEP